MRVEDSLMVRHRGNAVSDLQTLVIAQAEPHDPHRSFGACSAEAEIELPQRKVRLHGFVDLRQRDRFHRRQHFAQFARQIPARTELAQVAAHRVEAAALVEAPDFERLLRLRGRAIRFAGVAGQSQTVLV